PSIDVALEPAGRDWRSGWVAFGFGMPGTRGRRTLRRTTRTRSHRLAMARRFFLSRSHASRPRELPFSAARTSCPWLARDELGEGEDIRNFEESDRWIGFRGFRSSCHEARAGSPCYLLARVLGSSQAWSRSTRKFIERMSTAKTVTVPLMSQ